MLSAFRLAGGPTEPRIFHVASCGHEVTILAHGLGRQSVLRSKYQ